MMPLQSSFSCLSKRLFALALSFNRHGHLWNRWKQQDEEEERYLASGVFRNLF
jgi:hypothetical protein